MKKLLFALFFVGFIARTDAHHAHAPWFDLNETIEIEGYVNEFIFKNPHVNLIVTVVDENNVETQWMATAPATAPMRRWGWTDNMIQEGQYLRLVGRPRRDGGRMILLEGHDFRAEIDTVVEIDPADDSVIRVLGISPVERHAAQALALTGTETVFVVDRADGSVIQRRAAEPLAMILSDGRPNLAGTWMGGPSGSTGRTPPPWNEVGAANQVALDPASDPAFTECEAPGLVRTVMSINAVEIEQHDDRVVITFEGGGDGRVIYLDGRGVETNEHTRLGHHVARYENGALVIETSQLESRLSLITGNMLSDQVTTVETYRRSNHPARGPLLEMNIVITDPVYLDRPWEMSWQKPYAADEYEFTGVDCRIPFQASSSNEAIYAS